MFTRRDTIKTRLVTALCAVAFLLIAILSASPDLHEAIHPDEDHGSEHVCALTLINDGLVELVSLPERVSQPNLESTAPAPWRPVASEPTAPPFRLPWAVGPPELG